MERLPQAILNLHNAGLLRQLRVVDVAGENRISLDGCELENFASNDYLGLSRDEEIASAFAEGLRRFGVGSASSRLVSGSFSPHQMLEDQLALAKNTEAALVFSSGFATALGCLPAICGSKDIVVLDKLSHASLIDAAKLSGARVRIFPHNDVDRLREIVSSEREKCAKDARILVVTEAIFSMDGDCCPLREIVEVCESWDALLWLDEAHSFGLLGETGMGLVEQLGLEGRVAFQMGTLSKAAGLAGGYVAISHDWKNWFLNRARSFVYSTAPPPAQAFAACKAVEILRSKKGDFLREKLRDNQACFGSSVQSPIIPIVCGENHEVLRCADALRELGFFVPAIRYPTVPLGTARLRVSLSAAHEKSTIERLCAALVKVRG